ncbi:MAG: putative integral rane efflux protein [Verrucomicrobiales bacterium]|nr:putative integral rane efflux protein [Verrucomicrobiales bacterium]
MFRNRDFSRFLSARFIASFGQQMLTIAVGWELYERTHSYISLGLVGLSQFLPIVLLTLPSGHIADRYDRKRVILIMQLLLTFSSLGLALVSYLHADVFWVYCLLFASACARTFVWASSASLLPQLVSREEFPQAVTWSTSSFQFSAVTGPALGGLLIALTKSALIVYLFNAMAAAACFTLVWFVQTHHRALPKQKITLEALLGGFSFVFKTPIILGIMTLDLFAVLFGGATALLPVYAKDILMVGPTGLGLMESALPVGSLACALLIIHRPPMKKAGTALTGSVIVFALATIVFGLSKSFPLSLAMLFVCGFADNISVIVRHTLVQLLTPDEMRGRVSAVNSLFIGTSNELGGFESGIVAAKFGPVFSVVSGGIATIIAVIGVGWMWPEIRKYGPLVAPKKED